MDKRQDIEEALSIVWEEREKGNAAAPSVAERIKERLPDYTLEDLLTDGLVVQERGRVALTSPGEGLARDVIRRQRLAERLLIDVLEIGRQEMDSSACDFEHILSPGVVESICTLLGHPQECPHGLSIPPGECCRKSKGLIESIVVPLSRLKSGESGKIAYILTQKHPHLHRLMSFGIVPGAAVGVHQTTPSVIIKVDETEIALEREIAEGIFVRRISA